MNIELIKKRIENCFSFSHIVKHVDIIKECDQFRILLDVVCLTELKNIATEFGDDNIIILPGNNTIKLYISSLDEQLKQFEQEQKGIKMKTFDVTFTIETADCTTKEDICKSLEHNSPLIKLDLLEGNITNINVSELEFE